MPTGPSAVSETRVSVGGQLGSLGIFAVRVRVGAD